MLQRKFSILYEEMTAIKQRNGELEQTDSQQKRQIEALVVDLRKLKLVYEKVARVALEKQDMVVSLRARFIQENKAKEAASMALFEVRKQLQASQDQLEALFSSSKGKGAASSNGGKVKDGDSCGVEEGNRASRGIDSGAANGDLAAPLSGLSFSPEARAFIDRQTAALEDCRRLKNKLALEVTRYQQMMRDTKVRGGGGG